MPTCERIKEAVHEYNSGQGFRNDLALRAALGTAQSLPLSFGRFVTEVCVVANWGSFQLNGFPFEDRIAMAGEIETCWPLLQPMRSLRPDDWDTETVMMTRAVDVLFYTRLLPTPGAGRQLSFLSKYLHWCVNAGFPIWDQRARNALANLNDERSWDSYKGWLNQVRQEAANHRACCLEQIRLPGESLMRTLDKALYIIGAP